MYAATMSLRHALLGLLAAEPSSGYELTRRFEKALQRYAWHAQHSQIYPELTKLARDGLVTVAAEGPRGRRTYAITDTGRAELRRWMLNPPEAFTVRDEATLRLFLLSTLDADDARSLLHPLIESTTKEIAALRASIDATDAATPPGAALPFGRLVAEYGLRSFQTLREWAEWALKRIDEADA